MHLKGARGYVMSTKTVCPLVLVTLGGEECEKVKRWGQRADLGNKLQ
jgi:hypothetical protein